MSRPPQSVVGGVALPMDVLLSVAEILAAADLTSVEGENVESSESSISDSEDESPLSRIRRRMAVDDAPKPTPRRAIIMLSSTCKSLRYLFPTFCFFNIKLDPEKKVSWLTAQFYRAKGLPIPGDDSDYTDTKALLVAYPEIGRHVRQLTCIPHKLMAEDQELVGLLQNLDRLETIIIKSTFTPNNTSGYVDWNTCAEGLKLQKLLTGPIQLPTLKTLKIIGITNFPTAVLISPHSSLRNLGMHNCTMAPIDRDQFSSESIASLPLKLAKIDTVAMDRFAEVNAGILRSRSDSLPFFDFSNGIKSITIEFGRDIHVPQLEVLIDGVHNLESLTVTYHGGQSALLDGIFSRCATSLATIRQFTLKQKASENRYHNDYFLPFRSLKEVPSMLMIQELHISLYVIEQDLRSDRTIRDLRNLDRHLTTPSKFPELQLVTINVTVAPDLERDSELEEELGWEDDSMSEARFKGYKTKWAKLAPKTLPRLSRAGILKYSSKMGEYR